MGGQSHLLTKQAMEMVGTDIGNVGQVVEPDMLRIMLLQIFTDALYPLPLPSDRCKRGTRVCISLDALRQHKQEQRVPGEPGHCCLPSDVEPEKKSGQVL